MTPEIRDPAVVGFSVASENLRAGSLFCADHAKAHHARHRLATVVTEIDVAHATSLLGISPRWVSGEDEFMPQNASFVKLF